MGLLEASQAVIDCGQNELVLEDICRDSTVPDAWNFSRRQQTFALRENIATPSMVSTYRNGKVMSGLPTCSSETKSSLEECA
ncbi:hypothetical protein TNCV_4575501 [Trichonephila clavipes]|nr:hypothetical protein TNCV_4575501 [Trichonephila clavipes]